MDPAPDTLSHALAEDLDARIAPADRASVRALIPMYYAELRRIAHRERGAVSPFSTLDTTSVVHEAYLRLLDAPDIESPEHFLRLSATAMRYVLIDHLRGRMAAKRGGGQSPVSLDATGAPDPAADGALPEDAQLEIHEALNRLAEFAPRTAAVVECRYFGGYTDVETGKALGISERTVRNEWNSARAWLARELSSNS